MRHRLLRNVTLSLLTIALFVSTAAFAVYHDLQSRLTTVSVDDILGADRVTTKLDEALPDLDVVYMLRIQRERMSAAGGGFFPSPAEYSSVYGLTSARRRAMPEHAIVMHPGPMNRGLEITAEAADDPRSRIIEQVGNGVSVRMAALYLLLADEGNQL